MLSTQKNITAISLALIFGSATHAVTPESELETVTLSIDNLPRGLEVGIVNESCSGCHQVDPSISSVQASTEWVSITEQTVKTCGRTADK